MEVDTSCATATLPTSTEQPDSWICGPAPDNKHTRRALRRVYVDEATYGKGVFARRWIAEEEIIGRIQGKVIRDPDYTSDYCIEMIKHYTLEPAQPFCYLNHCCDPNCELVWVKVKNRKGKKSIRVLVEAIRDIAPGEQVTIDYAWPVEAAIPCGCGSPECRGWIVDEEELGACGM